MQGKGLAMAKDSGGVRINLDGFNPSASALVISEDAILEEETGKQELRRLNQILEENIQEGYELIIRKENGFVGHFVILA